MPIRGAEYAVRRMTTTLQTYLPAELDLIEAEEADGLALVDVAAAAYLEFESSASLVEHALAITLDAKQSRTLRTSSITNSPGLQHAEHEIVIGLHLKDVDNETPDITKRRVMRYARGIERVLAIRYPTMPLAGSETVFSVSRENAGEVLYRLNEEQGEGQFVRSAVIPFLVTTYEALA